MPRLIFTRCVYTLPDPPQTDPENGIPIVLVDDIPSQFAELPDEVYAPTWGPGEKPPLEQEP